MESAVRWALMWHSKNRLDGVREHFLYEDCMPVLFRTRNAARRYNEEHYGYIKTRIDLRVEPHGWRMPRPVRVKVVLAEK